MLVPSVLRNNSTSSAEHNAYLASLLLIPDDAGSEGSEAAPPAEPAGSGGAAAPPGGGDSSSSSNNSSSNNNSSNNNNSSSSSSMPPLVTLASSLKKKPVFEGTPRKKHDLEEMLQNLEAEIASLVLQILGIERAVEEVQGCIASGSAYRGRQGEALGVVEGKLASKELLMMEKEKQLRDEKMMLLRLFQGPHDSHQARRSTTRNNQGSVSPAAQRHVSFVLTSACVDDPAGERAEQRRLLHVNKVIQRRRSSSGVYLNDVGGSTDAVITMHKIEEDSRLLERLGALGMPILVSTLLAGFTLVLFDVAETRLARQLAVLSFALESSASIVLCLIAFRGQQLYSHATDVNPLTRKFLRRVRPVTVIALLAFAVGVIAFVMAFVWEASEELGTAWLAVIAVFFCPTLVAGVLFAVSTVQVRRHSIPPLNSE